METAWVTGTGGLIGHEIARAAPARWRVVSLCRADLDIADFAAVRARFAAERPALIIHCAAISKAAECEQDPGTAWRINNHATKLLSDLAASHQFVFVSTDLVFDGRTGNYSESDAPNPLNVYAKTKLAAEQAVLANPHLVIRTSLNGGASPHGNRSFTEQLTTLWKLGKAARLFTDEFRSPIMASVTARAVWELVESGAKGLLHVAGAERLSRYRIGELLAEHMQIEDMLIEPASVYDYPGPQRAPDTSLNSSKAQSMLSFRLPGFTEWLRAQR